jgi:hypothetical protein
MQPTYLPWIGYFGMMHRVDVFVLLDSVQFERRSWQQRNRINTAGGPLVLTVPVITAGRGRQKIVDVEIDTSRRFEIKHLMSMSRGYAKSPYYGCYLEELTTIYDRGYRYIAELNIALIEWIRRKLCISVQIERSSRIAAGGKRIELLVNICKALNATHYLSPPGSRVYLNGDPSFAENGIALSYHDFEHPAYRQPYSPFAPYLSAVDLLFNEGPDSLSIIQTGYREPAGP